MQIIEMTYLIERFKGKQRYKVEWLIIDEQGYVVKSVKSPSHAEKWIRMQELKGKS